ncbi:MAG TPA: DUF2085 domain-containing protein [Anaerolineae bacterium]|nr:DUF2085 domain-containing protein [Anaerolineae bacterium]
MFLPWLAPGFMKWGWTLPACWIYGFYALVCHQLSQRSFFLFGLKLMYSLPEIQVAWSDRMVLCTPASDFLFAWLWWPLRRKWRPLLGWVFVVFLAPLALDGTTHLLSDLILGVGLEFRYTNAWLVKLTNGAFPATFYTGDALGSFNSWMRLVSGLLFGLGVVG